VGDAVVKALTPGEAALRPDLSFATQAVKIPIENQKYLAAMKAGLLPAYAGAAATEVSADLAVMWLGPSVWMTMPGEPLPSVGLAAKALAASDHKFLVGLGNGELGYILDKDAWGQNTYDYEMSMSMGPKTAGLCLDGLKMLLAAAPDWTKPAKPSVAENQKSGTAKISDASALK
jgi:hypothetical protein